MLWRNISAYQKVWSYKILSTDWFHRTNGGSLSRGAFDFYTYIKTRTIQKCSPVNRKSRVKPYSRVCQNRVKRDTNRRYKTTTSATRRPRKGSASRCWRFHRWSQTRSVTHGIVLSSLASAIDDLDEQRSTVYFHAFSTIGNVRQLLRAHTWTATRPRFNSRN